MRIFIIFLAIFLGRGALAEDWNASITVTGSESVSERINGRGHSYDDNQQGTYFLADSFADGETCQTTSYFVADYFFGVSQAWEAQVFFSMEKQGNDFVVFYPAVAFSTVDGRDELIDTYYGDTSVKLDVTNLKCLPDGRFKMSIQFHGQLPLDDPSARGRVNVAGASAATLTFEDINDY